MNRITAVLFVVSGTTGLVYEVLWSRTLGTLFGAGTLAQWTVLSTWFLGLALGNALAGPWMDRRPHRALAAYAALELGIGAYGLISGHLLLALEPLYTTLVAGYAPEQNLFGIKVAVAMAALLLPTTLMGATLPALTRVLVHRSADVGRGVGWLYFLNSIGAAFGALFASLVAIPRLGMFPTLYATGAVNLAVGAVALGLVAVTRTRAVPGSESTPAAAPAPAAPDIPPAPVSTSAPDSAAALPASLSVGARWALPLVAFGTGSAALLVEVAWTRTFAIVFGSSTQAFSLMLFAFIGGIALGGLVASRWLARPGVDPGQVARISMLTGAACLAIALPAYETLPWLQFRLAQALERRDDVYPLYLACQTLLGFVWMLPFTLTAGITLPALAQVEARSRQQIAGSVGVMFAANTLGTVLAPFAAAYVLLPGLGVQGTLTTGVVIMLASVWGLVWAERSPVGRRAGTKVDEELDALAGRASIRHPALLPAAVSVLLGLWMALTPAWNPAAMHAGGFRRWTLPFGASFAEFQAQKSQVQVLFSHDGAVDSVVVVENGEGERFLKVNGKADASDTPDLATQQLVAHIPLLLHRATYPPAQRQVFVVGVGSGVTVGSAALHDQTDVTAVELSDGVMQASRYFDHVNADYASLPQVQAHVGDAREWLRRDPRRWDIIINQPSNPWVAGNGALFSREFFELSRDRLAPGGIMTQWMHVYAMDDAQIRMVLQTFASVYPHVTVWWPQAVDMVLIGSIEPLRPNLSILAGLLGEPDVHAQMSAHAREDLQVDSLDRFLALQVMSDVGFRQQFDGQTPPFTTDAQPLLEYLSPRTQYTGARATGLLQLDERLRPGPTRLFVGELPEMPAVDDLLQFFETNESPMGPLLADSLRHGLVEASDDVDRWAQMAGHAEGLPGILEPWTFQLLERDTLDGATCRTYIEAAVPALARRSSVFYAPATDFVIELMQRCAASNPDDALYFDAVAADILRRTGDLEAAADRYSSLLSTLPAGALREQVEEQAAQVRQRLE